MFQSPSRRGRRALPPLQLRMFARRDTWSVSVPFVGAGARPKGLQCHPRDYVYGKYVSVPFSSGSARAVAHYVIDVARQAGAFQSPFRRGRRAPFTTGNSRKIHVPRELQVSVPFSSGSARAKKILALHDGQPRSRSLSFSPLLVGASARAKKGFVTCDACVKPKLRFSPLLVGASARDRPCNSNTKTGHAQKGIRFSPLLVGASGARRPPAEQSSSSCETFQSPSSVGARQLYQHATLERVSVPFSSGHRRAP